MSGDYCPTITIKVDIQENGIIREFHTGRIIGRLIKDKNDDWVKFSNLMMFNIKEDK